jgi:hypothetical protein
VQLALAAPLVEVGADRVGLVRGARTLGLGGARASGGREVFARLDLASGNIPKSRETRSR